MQAPLSIDEVFCYAAGRACPRAGRASSARTPSTPRTHSLTPTRPTRIGRRSPRAPTARRSAARTSSRCRAARRTSPPRCGSPRAHGVPVVAWGGGSGTQGGAVPIHGGLVVDLRGLDRIVEIDERSMTVTAQAGVNGRALERGAQRARADAPALPGLARSGRRSAATSPRAARACSRTRYGKIEDLVLSLRVALAERRADRHRRASRATPSARTSRSCSSAPRARSGSSRARRSRSSRCRPSAASSRCSSRTVDAGVEAFRAALAARPPAVRDPHVRRGGDAAHALPRRRRAAGRRAAPSSASRASRAGRGRRGVPHRRARARGGRARARPRARRDAGGTAATSSTSRRITRSCPRSGARSTSSRPTRDIARRPPGAQDRRARPLRRPTASSCGCTSRTGTAGAR